MSSKLDPQQHLRESAKRSALLPMPACRLRSHLCTGARSRHRLCGRPGCRFGPPRHPGQRPPHREEDAKDPKRGCCHGMGCGGVREKPRADRGTLGGRCLPCYPEFLHNIFSEGVNRGADRLCFCDTVGVLTPEKVADYIPPLSKIAPLSIHCHDDLGFALTNTMAALKSGATCAHVTVNGLGERAGNTPLEDFVMALEILYGCKTRSGPRRSMRFRTLSRASRAYRFRSTRRSWGDGVHARERDPCPWRYPRAVDLRVNKTGDDRAQATDRYSGNTRDRHRSGLRSTKCSTKPMRTSSGRL